MARRLKLTIEYDGTDFFGWQRQGALRTVQGTLEDGVRELVGESVEVRGAGEPTAAFMPRGRSPASPSRRGSRPTVCSAG